MIKIFFIVTTHHWHVGNSTKKYGFFQSMRSKSCNSSLQKEFYTYYTLKLDQNKISISNKNKIKNIFYKNIINRSHIIFDLTTKILHGLLC